AGAMHRTVHPGGRVRRGGGEGARRRPRRTDVDDERAREDRRPDAIAERQERGERDSGRRPDRRRARVHGREREPELSREDVEAEQTGQTERIFATGEHMRVRALVPAGSVRTGPNLSLEVATLAPLRGERNLKVSVSRHAARAECSDYGES